MRSFLAGALPDALREQRFLDWSALPSMNDAYQRARADLEARVDVLLDRIRNERQAQPAIQRKSS